MHTNTFVQTRAFWIHYNMILHEANKGYQLVMSLLISTASSNPLAPDRMTSNRGCAGMTMSRSPDVLKGGTHTLTTCCLPHRLSKTNKQHLIDLMPDLPLLLLNYQRQDDVRLDIQCSRKLTTAVQRLVAFEPLLVWTGRDRMTPNHHALTSAHLKHLLQKLEIVDVSMHGVYTRRREFRRSGMF